MAYRLIKKFTEMLGEHTVDTFSGAISPLLLTVPWSKNPAIPITLFEINRGRETLLAIDEYYYHLCSEERFREYFEKKISKEQLEKEYYDYATKTQDIWDEASRMDFPNETEESIVRFLKKVIVVWEQVASTVYIETFNYDMALKVIGKENKHVLDTVWEQATHPTFISFEGRRLEHLVKLVSGSGDLSAVVAGVRYIYTDYFWTKSDVDILVALGEIRDTLPEKERELASIYENLNVRKSAYEEWEKSLTPEQKFLAEYMQMIMLFRDIRKDPIAQAQAILILVTTELLKRAGIDPKYGIALNMYECAKGVAYLKSIKDEIVARARGNISITYLNSTVETELCDYEKAIEEFYALTTQPSVGSVDTLKGQTANKGKVTGTVRVVLDAHDDKGFVQGDILVTSMTRPEFVPLMKRAGGVITNEGGITCHAAIVSRELGIPCIIGTKNATRVLRDGDLVEVDANSGVVHIIKRA